jgi:hypothetical protein
VAVCLRDENELPVSTKCTEILVFHVSVIKFIILVFHISVIQFIMQGNYSAAGKLLLIEKVSAACRGKVHSCTLCTGRTAHRGSRGIALLFYDHGTGRG